MKYILLYVLLGIIVVSGYIKAEHKKPSDIDEVYILMVVLWPVVFFCCGILYIFQFIASKLNDTGDV